MGGSFSEPGTFAESFVTFSKMFGDLDHAPQMENGKTAVDGFPEIYIVSNILDDNDKPSVHGAGKLFGIQICRICPIHPISRCFTQLRCRQKVVILRCAAWQQLMTRCQETPR